MIKFQYPMFASSSKSNVYVEEFKHPVFPYLVNFQHPMFVYPVKFQNLSSVCIYGI